MWRGLLVAAIGLMMAAAAQATPLVTYTLSLNESPTGTVAAGQFAIYATVSQGDNSGLVGFAVDLIGSGQAGGPSGFTMFNRSPTGGFAVDPNDPNYDPVNYYYPTMLAGFSTGRGVNASTGVVSAVQELGARDRDVVYWQGGGQVAHNMNDFRPPPNTSSGLPVSYGNYVMGLGTDNPIGFPFNRAGATLVPAGSIRLATGTYNDGGLLPSFDNLGSVNNKAYVWKLNTSNEQYDLATLTFCLRDFSGAQAMEILPGQSCVVVPEPGLAGVWLLVGIVIQQRRWRR